MEDVVEQTLESNQPLNLSSLQNPTSLQNESLTLQHEFRAPTTSSSSSQTFANQESSFENEDEEARKRQSFINAYLEKDDENWKRERLERILGKYKHVMDNSDGDGNGNGDGDGNGNGGIAAGSSLETLEDKWRQIIQEEKKRVDDGML